MKSISFFKKETNEIIKTSKWIILTALFMFFGLLSPLSARYINEILQGLGGVDIKLPEPTHLDSYAQVFKNLYSILAVVVVLVFMSTVVDEKVKGSVILVLTKRLSRPVFITSKFVAAVMLFTVAYVVSSISAIYYTYFLFPEFYINGLWMAFLMFWVYGIFIIALTIFASTISKSHTMAAVIGFIGFAISAASGSIPYLGDYMPGVLQGLSMEMLAGIKTTADGVIPLITTLLLTVLILAGSITIFSNQEL